MKNTDNKIIAGVSVRLILRHDMKRNTHSTQRGFVPDRQLVHNAIDLDSSGRILALQAIKHNQAVKPKKLALAWLAFFDFAAASKLIISLTIVSLSSERTSYHVWQAKYDEQLSSERTSYHVRGFRV